MESLEACAHGNLSDLPQHQDSEACKRAVAGIDLCVEMKQHWAAQRLEQSQQQRTLPSD